MSIHVSDRQLARIERGREPALIVRSERTKRGYAVISKDLYDQVHPLLSSIANQTEAAERGNGHSAEWPDAKNSRRIELIYKKHEGGLTAPEKKELATLVIEAERFRDRMTPVRTDILELILAGLKHRPAKKKAKR